MDRETQNWYEEQFSMMSTKGWKDFVDQCKEMKDQYSDVSVVPDLQTLYKRHGQLDLLNWILGWKEACEKAYQELQDEKNL